MTTPSKVAPGDRVAVVSPSAALAGTFPHVYERGLRVLREDLGLVPVEYPTTRAGGTPAERAADLMAAFADDSVAAVMATVGGEDLITVLPYLDDKVLAANPKPFFGYSDNTCLLQHLHGLGVAGWYGGSVMAHLGRVGGPHPYSMRWLRTALSESGWRTLEPPAEFTDEDAPWHEPAAVPPPVRPATPWRWAGAAAGPVEGPTWGGCVEVVAWLLMAGRVPELPDGAVLLLETSEELVPAREVYRIMRSMGERGLLQRCDALLMGRPKAWSVHDRRAMPQRHEYVAAQHAAVLRAMGEYAPSSAVVLDVDFGHTSPQLVLPYGGAVRVDPAARTVSARY
ncbi:LD-carboxypeptidase [Pilimelia terevasa]|uniref:LD-carboxypeptidase n=1 Tax=Pilimelia terevasa TaxID=53372 RepID=A0A8J3BJB2_9ACTN|nr:S66 peptidase family protein [Pilimelia terevasa]GGK14615.1 LD-carboxypeptidase [Pilimelia terevasa]